mmetsp:Transcript_577/g.1521  ORF Transcript_577/g.1521 Transcript_577/m.1521 type:complete len:80 (-) Transcript_577:2227-2466(-)
MSICAALTFEPAGTCVESTVHRSFQDTKASISHSTRVSEGSGWGVGVGHVMVTWIRDMAVRLLYTSEAMSSAVNVPHES